MPKLQLPASLCWEVLAFLTGLRTARSVGQGLAWGGKGRYPQSSVPASPGLSRHCSSSELGNASPRWERKHLALETVLGPDGGLVTQGHEAAGQSWDAGQHGTGCKGSCRPHTSVPSHQQGSVTVDYTDPGLSGMQGEAAGGGGCPGGETRILNPAWSEPDIVSHLSLSPQGHLTRKASLAWGPAW